MRILNASSLDLRRNPFPGKYPASARTSDSAGDAGAVADGSSAAGEPGVSAAAGGVEGSAGGGEGGEVGAFGEGGVSGGSVDGSGGGNGSMGASGGSVCANAMDDVTTTSANDERPTKRMAEGN